MTTSKTPSEIIRELLNDSDLYQEKAARESEVWGRIFSNEKQIEFRKTDRAAAKTLRVGRDKMSLIPTLRRQGLQPVSGLSLACGSGRAERNFIAQGICQRFHGVDVAEKALEEARKEAASASLDITYEQGDLNSIQLKPASFDLVLAQNCLHHVLQLEHLADQIHRSLTPQGALWIDDYVGETQFQYSEKRIETANAVLALLPEKFRTNRATGKIVDQVKRPVPGRLISPFEAIRSAEIMPVFLERFEVLERRQSGGIMRLVTPLGAKTEYAQSEDTRALFALLQYLDETLVKEGVIEPSGTQCLLRPK